MVARNDITGDAIQTRTASQAYRDNYDNIWKKDKDNGRSNENQNGQDTPGTTELNTAQRDVGEGQSST
jgi:hypothetical protein